MPSAPKKQPDSSVVFIPILILTFILWMFYRSVFHFPVWFDETIGKALFFGLPVWLYITITQNRHITDTFGWQKFEPGILLGLAFGGIYGFVASIFFVWLGGGGVQPALLFASPVFWNEFLLALMTGFWETLLFYSMIQTVLMRRYPRWSLARLVLVITGLFIAFHIPNMLLRSETISIVWQLPLLTLFAAGQALIFYRTKNSYILILSHAFWGLVLLMHG